MALTEEDLLKRNSEDEDEVPGVYCGRVGDTLSPVDAAQHFECCHPTCCGCDSVESCHMLADHLPRHLTARQ